MAAAILIEMFQNELFKNYLYFVSNGTETIYLGNWVEIGKLG